MKKISIITMHCIRNYGSVLQTYATQKFFEKCGFQPEIINYLRSDSIDPAASVKTYLANNPRWNSSFIKRSIFRIWKQPIHTRQFQVFNGFLTRHITISPKKYTAEEELEKEVFDADYFCVGSDQMWNSDYNKGIEEPYFLSFVKEKSKCFSFSTSIGKENLSENESSEIKKRISGFREISVREESAKKILENIGLRNVTHLVDPTLLLTKEEWKSIMAPYEPRNKYLLIYQLNKNPEFDSYAVSFAKKKGLQIKRINLVPENAMLPGESIYLPDPEMFLSLFENASYVLTDSFHGTSFCLNFQKDFSVFPPEKYATRIESILSTFHLNDRIILPGLEIKHNDVNYKNFDKILEEEKEKAIKFIKRTCI